MCRRYGNARNLRPWNVMKFRWFAFYFYANLPVYPRQTVRPFRNRRIWNFYGNPFMSNVHLFDATEARSINRRSIARCIQSQHEQRAQFTTNSHCSSLRTKWRSTNQRCESIRQMSPRNRSVENSRTIARSRPAHYSITIHVVALAPMPFPRLNDNANCELTGLRYLHRIRTYAS